MLWMSAFLDFAPVGFDGGVRFWRGVTGYSLSPPRGVDGEFATLVPPYGEDHLRVQRLGAGPGRIHLDLHVPDPQAAADRAAGLGATVALRHDLGYVVMASPGGLTFCFVGRPASQRAPAATWPGGHRSVVDQVCLDIGPAVYDEEYAFWQRLTGWEPQDLTEPEFRRLVRPSGQPLHLLFQRLDDGFGPVRAHLDIATTDRAAETERHLALGASLVDVRHGWTVLRDPSGAAYCLTDRAPEIGSLDDALAR